ncbi:MAG: DUF3800 domain-containing protein [Candidatus Rokubacteria bacterium]|nr:DUF3800 domain-containing protein [Candidatus Rokubacteria bacterium]
MPTLHVHLDESGNLGFAPTGTRYYVFAAAWTYDPAPLAHDLTRLRFMLLKQGHNLPAFHATTDRQVNRDAVVEALARHTNWHFAAVVIEKAKVNPVLREAHRFYPKFASSVLKFIFRRHLVSGTSTILIFTDTLPVAKHREAAEKAIKTACRQELDASIRFESYHHPSASNAWIQAADYCSWATFKKWEHGDVRTYEVLRARLAAPELDALKAGTTKYY